MHLTPVIDWETCASRPWIGFWGVHYWQGSLIAGCNVQGVSVHVFCALLVILVWHRAQRRNKAEVIKMDTKWNEKIISHPTLYTSFSQSLLSFLEFLGTMIRILNKWMCTKTKVVWKDIKFWRYVMSCSYMLPYARYRKYGDIERVHQCSPNRMTNISRLT